MEELPLGSRSQRTGSPILARNTSELQDVEAGFLIADDCDHSVEDPSFWRESWYS